jgi:hypothetical protein
MTGQNELFSRLLESNPYFEPSVSPRCIRQHSYKLKRAQPSRRDHKRPAGELGGSTGAAIASKNLDSLVTHFDLIDVGHRA